MIKSRCGIVCDTKKCKEAFGVDYPDTDKWLCDFKTRKENE